MSALSLNRFKHFLGSFRESLTFDSGLYGLEDARHFSFVAHKNELPFLWLINEKYRFVVIDPFVICPEYDPAIQARFDEPAFLLSIVSLQKSRPTLNLAAPLLIEWDQKCGRQLLLPGEPTDFFFDHYSKSQ